MSVSKIGYRLSAIGYRLSAIGYRLSESFSQKLGLIFRKITRRINRQHVKICTPGTKVYLQHNIHPSQAGSTYAAEKAFKDLERQKIIFHCYWHGKFGRKQAMSVKSLLSTQNDYNNEVWLWLDKDSVHENGNDNPYIQQLAGRVRIIEYAPELVKSIPAFRKIYFLFGETEDLPLRSDFFRLWVLHEYGGCYFDLDVMFIRNMRNLFTGDEFVYSWEKQLYANSAIIFLRKGSCLSEYIVRKVTAQLSAKPWVIFSYDDKNLKYLRLYECSLFDPIWDDARESYIFHEFKGFFRANPAITNSVIKSPADMFPYSYCYHWHNHWNDAIEPDSPFEFCEKEFDAALGIVNA